MTAQSIINLGSAIARDGIQSSMGPFHFFPGYQTRYPEVVVRALGRLYMEYNRAFQPLVRENLEWEDDYQFCFMDGQLVNYGVQVDMVGLTDEFLLASTEMHEDEVMERLRRQIFEIENSLAMYQLLNGLFAENGQSFFSMRFRRALDGIRRQFGMPIALLAVTNEKYQAMRETEFGKFNGSPLFDEEVYAMSGFDRLFGPDEFRTHLIANGGACEYLLYARTSDPVEKLKHPDMAVEHPLLGDPELRRVIKRYALTFNIDAPGMNSKQRINDTKGYMPSMGMAHLISSDGDLFSPDFGKYLSKKKPFKDFSGDQRLSFDFSEFLVRFGVNPEGVASGATAIRLKPAKGAYGCYGHLAGPISDTKMRGELRRNLRLRPGGYVVQPEMRIPQLVNEADGITYAFIDRNFLAMIEGEPQFIGGFRSLMPIDSVEAQRGRNHGSQFTIWGEISA